MEINSRDKKGQGISLIVLLTNSKPNNTNLPACTTLLVILTNDDQ